MKTKHRFAITMRNETRGEPVPPCTIVGPIIRLPDTQHVIEIELDLEKIANTLGPKAVRSRGKRSQEMSGLVVVRAIN